MRAPWMPLLGLAALAAAVLVACGNNSALAPISTRPGNGVSSPSVSFTGAAPTPVVLSTPTPTVSATPGGGLPTTAPTAAPTL